jgi:hypothetical protein
MPRTVRELPNGFATGFKEIARRERVAISTVFNAYESGMAKLRANPEALTLLVALANEMERNRRHENPITVAEVR